MKNLFLALLGSLILFSCEKNDSSNNAAPGVKTEGIDGSIWYVVSKVCGRQDQTVLGQEKFQFDNGFFAHIYSVPGNSADVCYQAQVFSRGIQSSGTENSVYNEVSNLVAQQKRNVCKDKNTNAVTEDQTTSFSSVDQVLAVTLTGNQGTADISNSPSCNGDVLHFTLRKK